MDQNNLYQVYFFERNNERNKALSLQTAGTGRGIIASVWCHSCSNKKRWLVGFPPLGGCREGFLRYPHSRVRRINPSLPLHIPNTPLPREGIK
jgi:hypothetical protein